MRAHRFSWRLTSGEAVLCVLHKCDSRLCVRPDHLFEGTNKDNTVDAKKKGRLAKGQRHGNAKLTDAEVEMIRGDSRSNSELARLLGVTQATIQRIRSHKSRVA